MVISTLTSICIPLCTAAQRQRHSFLSGLLGAEEFFLALLSRLLGNQPIEVFVDWLNMMLAEMINKISASHLVVTLTEVENKRNEKFIEIEGKIKVSDKVKMRQYRQVEIVKEIKGKKAVLQVGIMPMTVLLEDLTMLRDKEIKE